MTSSAMYHRTILITILKDLFEDELLAPYLGFKGGTAAMLFYDLPRFSVDLDFDLLLDPPQELIFNEVVKILKKYGEVKKADDKRYTLFFLLSYEGKQVGVANIKVEINKRNYNSQYEILSFLGIPMRVMSQRDMVVHKLLAIYNSLGKANRDIFDVHFFLQNRWNINDKIIESIMKMPYEKFLMILIDALEKFDDSQILSGLGELLSIEQRSWVQRNLKKETIFFLRLLLNNVH